MLLLSRAAGVLSLRLNSADPSKPPTINSSESVIILPGLTDVPEEAVRLLQSHPVLKLRFESQDGAQPLLEIPRAAAQSSNAAVALQPLKQSEAMRLIADTTDRDLLAKWSAEETVGKRRVTILGAIARQLKKLAPEGTPAVDEEGDDDGELHVDTTETDDADGDEP